MVTKSLFSPNIRFILIVVFIFISLIIIGYKLLVYQQEKDNGLHINVEKYFSSNIPKELLSSIPPDPGKLGKETIEGIDSNKNEIRDDVERAIIFISPNSHDKKEAMNQLSRALEKHIVSTSEAEAVATNEDNKMAWACLKLIENESWLETSSIVKSLVLNTKERIDSYFKAQKLIGTSFGTDFETPCKFKLTRK